MKFSCLLADWAIWSGLVRQFRELRACLAEPIMAWKGSSESIASKSPGNGRVFARVCRFCLGVVRGNVRKGPPDPLIRNVAEPDNANYSNLRKESLFWVPSMSDGHLSRVMGSQSRVVPGQRCRHPLSNGGEGVLVSHIPR
ncbi:hypothetical protein CDAR_124511 [Caerostris darwini]|uniref:Uncharacterized protein n=1 Tax=Caerostris darwini TaxID=1538125 RepID=A0AAV4RI48_9ARAC|nr:hypothetical protein CDAR_124511 [Caerostris darwini]